MTSPSKQRLVPLFGFAPGDAYPATCVTTSAVGSYPTISPSASAIGGIFSVALVSDCSAWALPSTLPYGVRTFLSRMFRERSPGPLPPPPIMVRPEERECKGSVKTEER